MTPYKSKSRKTSGVIAYELGEDYIRIKFRRGDVYTYSYRSADANTIEVMKGLALASKGLSTYISQHQPAYE